MGGKSCADKNSSVDLLHHGYHVVFLKYVHVQLYLSRPAECISHHLTPLFPLRERMSVDIFHNFQGESWGWGGGAQIKVAAWIYCSMVTAAVPGKLEISVKVGIALSS